MSGFVCQVDKASPSQDVNILSESKSEEDRLSDIQELIQNNPEDRVGFVIGFVNQLSVGSDSTAIRSASAQLSDDGSLLFAHHSCSWIDDDSGIDIQEESVWQLTSNHIRWSSRRYTHQLELTDGEANPISVHVEA